MKDMKFPKKEGMPDGIWTRMKMGIEILVILKQSADSVDSKNARTTKGLLRHFDIIGQFNEARVNQYKQALEWKKRIYGKEFLDMCIMVAIEMHKKADLDIIQILGLNAKNLPQLE